MNFTKRLAAKYIIKANEEDQPSEDDAFLAPSGPLGSKTSLSIEQKFIGEFSSDEEAEEAIVEWINKNKVWPGIWYVSDHGNVHPYTMSDSAQKKINI